MATSTKTKTQKAKKTAKPAKAPAAKKSPFPKKVGLFILYVPDMKKAVDFYKNTLQLSCEYESPEWTQFSAGIDFALHIEGMCEAGSSSCSTASGEKKSHETGIVFVTDSTRATYDAYKAAGIKVKGEPMNVCESTFCFSFEDPFGNVLSVSGAK